MHFLQAMLISLLPPRYRRALGVSLGERLVAAAGVSGFLEMMIFGTLYIKGFVDYIAQAVIGPTAFLEYFFYPRSWPLAFFFFDGGLRLLGAFAGQALGTIPLYVVSWIQTWHEGRVRRSRLGPLVADTVERGDGARYELRISSCRPRHDWDKWMTVLFEENLYEIVSAKLGVPPRPYVYFLRAKPQWKVIRGLHNYHPNEVFSLED
jgi:hypothetical protein